VEAWSTGNEEVRGCSSSIRDSGVRDKFWFTELSAFSTLSPRSPKKLSVGPAPSLIRASRADHPRKRRSLSRTLISTIRNPKFTPRVDFPSGSNRFSHALFRSKIAADGIC
jgi:hypothetical protein